MFSYEFCNFSKNTFFTEYLWATASVFDHSFHSISQIKALLLKLHTWILSCEVLLFLLEHVQKQQLEDSLRSYLKQQTLYYQDLIYNT